VQNEFPYGVRVEGEHVK